MSKCQRSVIVRRNQSGSGWWVILRGIGDNGTPIEYACVDPDRREPFADIGSARDAAKWIASHYTNDDGTTVQVTED